MPPANPGPVVRTEHAMVFQVVMYGCESWTIKKAEHQRINAFELWCWRRLMRVPCAMQEMQVPSLDQEDPLEQVMDNPLQ